MTHDTDIDTISDDEVMSRFYGKHFNEGRELADKTRSEFARAQPLVAASAGLALALESAALPDGDVEAARRCVRETLLLYWRDNIDDDAARLDVRDTMLDYWGDNMAGEENEEFPVEMTTEDAVSALELARTLSAACEDRSRAAVFWLGLVVAAESAWVANDIPSLRARLGVLLFLLRTTIYSPMSSPVKSSSGSSSI